MLLPNTPPVLKGYLAGITKTKEKVNIKLVKHKISKTKFASCCEDCSLP